MKELIAVAIIYGLCGMMMEVFFTSIQSILAKDWTLKGQTFLWMFPLYSVAGTSFDIVNESVHFANGWDWLFLPFFIYTPMIYGYELLYGFLLDKLIGKCPWHYGDGKWSIMGLCRIDFAPYWLILGFCVKPLGWAIGSLIRFIFS